MKRSIVDVSISRFLIVFLAALPVLSFSQSNTLTCTDFKNGIFYLYPKNSEGQFFCRRDGNFQYEVDLKDKNADTLVWKINWTDDCTYTLKYISGGKKLDEATAKLLKKHKLAYEITKSTADYYVFKGYIDNTSGNAFQADTMWVTEKNNIVNNALFDRVSDPAVLYKDHFRDTSKYAILYVYRPGKITNSLGNFLVYFDENPMWVARNRSGYIFKILREGKFNITSRLFKDESSVTLDIKFGKTYYAKSMIHWGISSRLYNFKLEMAQVDEQLGKDEFDKVNIR